MIEGGKHLDTSSQRRQQRWFLLARILVVTAFLGGTIAYQLRGGEAGQDPALPFLYGLVGITYLQTFLSSLVLARTVRFRTFFHFQVSWDLLFVTSLVYATGGIESIFSFLYILVVIAASIFLSRQEVLFVASAAAILYGSLLDLQFYDYLPHFVGLTFPEHVEGSRVFHAVFINVIAFYLTALLSGSASERLRRSESALEKKEIDYEELNSLNRTILANITSGLMIVHRNGAIRSFNTAARKITGYSLEEVYDRDIRLFFPHLQVLGEEDFLIIQRGEAEIVDRQGQHLVLGYATSRVEEGQGREGALLVTFQDLTEFKKMEAQLKRTDRLAAVGRLAAGMAHEIRNPLASISGSVQLLLEREDTPEEDRRLMGIVVREADRLSGLLTDFLLYARPTPPRLYPVNVSALLREITDILKTDSRFEAVEVRCEAAGVFRVSADRQQLYQALWNLVINAAEAMSGEGVLRVGIDADKKKIFVEDTGPGIPEEIREKIFDPFFTTKDMGTGLGLATVYTIVEAHRGRIEVESGRRGGARFCLHFPEEISSGAENPTKEG